MTTFYDQLDAILDASKGGDRVIHAADAFFFDFKTVSLRVWAGVGELITPDGESWAGFFVPKNGGGYESLFHMPPLKDPRDGTSPLIEMSLHYLDKETYEACRDMQDEVKGRPVLISSVLLPEHGTRALTDAGDARRLIMSDTRFTERTVRNDAGNLVTERSITVVAKNMNVGRSKTYFGTLSDTVQRARSLQIHGVADDAYAQFTGKYAGGYTITLS